MAPASGLWHQSASAGEVTEALRVETAGISEILAVQPTLMHGHHPGAAATSEQ